MLSTLSPRDRIFSAHSFGALPNPSPSFIDIVPLSPHELLPIECREVVVLESNSPTLDVALPLSLAGNLPIDIVQELLDQWVDIDSDAPLIAMQICRRWYEAVVSHSLVWRHIHLNPIGVSVEAFRNRVARRLQYAGTSPLEIHLRWHDHRSLMFGNSVEVASALRQYQSAMLSGIAEIRRRRSTWRSLVVHVTSASQIKELLNLLCPMSQPFAPEELVGLQDIRIMADECQPSIGQMGWVDLVNKESFLGHMTNLRSFTVLGCCYNGEPPAFFASLRSLTLGRGAVVKAWDLRRMIESCSALQNLTLVQVSSWHANFVQHGAAIIHPSLLRLRILCVPPSPYHFWAEEDHTAGVVLKHMRLTLPRLQLLQLDRPPASCVCSSHPLSCRCSAAGDQFEPQRDSAEGDTVLGFIVRSSAPLLELQLAGLKTSETQLLKILRLTPGLKRLTAEFPPSLLPHLAIAADLDVNSSLCPMLEDLTLVGCHMQHAEGLLAVARSRRRLIACRASGRWEGKPLRTLHIQGCSRMKEYADDVAEAIPEVSVSFTDTVEKLYRFTWDR